MATVTTNISQVVSRVRSNFELLLNKEYLLRPLASELIPLMKTRIHVEGQATDGGQIGTYSSEYMKVRTGNYGNSVKFVKGAKKGQIKNAGIFSKKKVQLYGYNQGVFIDATKDNKARPNYNRSNDTKVIISLTTQLEQDYAVVATEKGYGIGFNNKHNRDKAGWVEETYSKIIFNLSAEEKQYISERLQELVNGAFDS